MEQIHDYPNVFTTSESTSKIVSALLLFNKSIGVIDKDAKNPFFRSDYAPLPTILKDIKEPMFKAGLTINHFPIGDNHLLTRVAHTSGEYFESTYFMKSVKDTPQDRGSVITYMMRDAVGAILGLAIDKDDDGNGGTHAKPQAPVQPQLKNLTAVVKDTMLKYIKDGQIELVRKQLPKYGANANHTVVKKALSDAESVADMKDAETNLGDSEKTKTDKDA